MAQPSLEQQDASAVHFRNHLTRLADASSQAESEAISDWMLRRRDDQQVVYFVADEPLDDSPLSQLRRKRADNLLRHAAAAAEEDQLADAYRLFWQAARENPHNKDMLRAIGLPDSGRPAVSIRQGTSASKQLNWPARSYLRIQTPHFLIDARCERARAVELAAELERVYWIWTQVFYRLWEKPASIRSALTGVGRFEPRITRHRVVVLPDRQAYINALSEQMPGIERSTGYYANRDRVTFLFTGVGADAPTRYHEITHQLIGEATTMRSSSEPGLNRDFWVVEGAATYMESLRFFDNFATVGGWESPRLQFSRYRTRSQRDSMPLERLIASGRDAVQQSPDIARWYSFAAAYSHLYLDSPDRKTFVEYVRSVYENRSQDRTLPDAELASSLDVSDADIRSLRRGTQLQQLCLANTSVTNDSIEHLKHQRELRWLDLSGLPVEDEAVGKLIANNPNIDQLSLERSSIGDEASAAIATLANLKELDVSVTPLGDANLARFSGLEQLETLWLTASSVTDESIEVIAGLPKLVEVDLQATRVSDTGIARLRELRPNLRINPLQIVAAP